MKILSEPIDAIVRFKSDASKKPLPYKFRFKDVDNNFCEVKIDKVISVEETKFAGVRSIVYLCSSTISEIEKLYELRYIVNEFRWELYKM